MQAQCTECDQPLFVPHSCGHRACPHCQHHESQQWLERQLKKQVPADVFPVDLHPAGQVRTLARAHQRVLYSLLDALQLGDRTNVRRQRSPTPGQRREPSAVLHTHSRRLDYHPHVHLVMPAAAMDAESKLWRTKTAKGQSGYLFNHKALAKVFRAKLLAAITEAGLALAGTLSRSSGSWMCKSVGTGEKALVYLGPLSVSRRDPGERHRRPATTAR